jgi:hypothetical protein
VDRHLQPNEIDLLLDGEEGFGVSALKAHLRNCDQCQAELDGARLVASALEHLPHHAPSPGFAEFVMRRVEVFEPWHVAALDTARRWLPRSRPARAIALGVAGSLSLVVTAAVVLVATRLDQALFFFSLATERLRSMAVEGAGSALAALFGDSALTALRGAGPIGVTVGLVALLATFGTATLGLRALAIASRRRRQG